MRFSAPASSATLSESPGRLRHFLSPFFLLYGALGVYFPYHSLWLRDRGISDSDIALITSMLAVATLVWGQVWGYVADTLLPPRRLIFFNAFAACATFLLFPPFRSVPALCAVMFIFSTFSAPLGQLLNSLLLSHERGERNFSVIRSAGSIGFVCVNLAAGWLCRREGTSVIFLFYGLMLALFLISLLALRPRAASLAADAVPLDAAAGTGATTGPVPRTAEGDRDLLEEPPPPRTRIGFAEVQRILLRRPGMVVFLCFVVLYQMSHQLSHAFQGLWMRNLGGNDVQVSYCYSLAAAAEVLVFWFSDRLLAGRSAVRFMIAAALVQATRWTLVWAFPSIAVVIWSNLLHAVTFGLFFAASVVFVHRLSPAELRTSGQTLLALAYFGFAALGGNLLGSIVIRALGLRAWFGAAAVLALASAILGLSIPHSDLAALRNSAHSTSNPSGFESAPAAPAAQDKSSGV